MPKKNKKNKDQKTIAATGPAVSRECIVILPNLVVKLPKGIHKTGKQFKELYKKEVKSAMDTLARRISGSAFFDTGKKGTPRDIGKVKQDGKIHFDICI